VILFHVDVYSFICLVIQLFIRSSIYLSIHLLIHPLTHSSIHLVIHPPIDYSSLLPFPSLLPFFFLSCLSFEYTKLSIVHHNIFYNPTYLQINSNQIKSIPPSIPPPNPSTPSQYSKEKTNFGYPNIIHYIYFAM
jgi:Leucine-rich repeat (LRR) protein